jgi:hypothetical protein
VSILSGFKKINWINDVLTPLTVILMECLWLYPWLYFLGKQLAFTVRKQPLSLLSLIVILGVSFITNKLFQRRRWSILWIQLSIMAVGLLTIFLVIRIEYGDGFPILSGQWFASYGQVLFDIFAQRHPLLLALVAAFYLWWRGISLSRSTLYFEDIYKPFLIELATLVLLVIMWGITLKIETLPKLTANIGIYIIGFFFFGLISMALVNLRLILEKMKNKGEASSTLSRRWVSIIVTVIGGIVLLGIGFASIFSAQFVSSFQRFVSTISGLYDKIVYFIFYAVGFVVQLIGYVYQWLLNLFIHKKTVQPTQQTDLGEPDKINGIVQGSISPQVILILKWIIIILVLIAVVFFISRAIMRNRARAKDELEEENESLWSWGGFKADLVIFFDMLLHRFKRKTKPATVNPSLNWQADEDIKRRLSIREIYQHLLWQAARLRIPRESYETPSEYAGRLGQAVPDSKVPLDEITNLYIDVRYGEHQMEEKKIDDANNIWEKLRNLLKGIEGK